MTRIISAAAVAVMLIAGAAANSGAATLIDRVVAIVGPDVVTQSELDVEMAAGLDDMEKRLRGDELASAKAALRRNTLDRLIDKKLQLQEARFQGIGVTEEELDNAIKDIKERNSMDDAQLEEALANEGYTMPDYRQSLKEQLMIIRLVSAAVRSRVMLDEKDVENYYNEHIGEFTVQESVRVANIFFPAKKGDMEAALEEAKAAREDIEAGTPFEEMAVKCTGDPDASKSCVLGTFGHGQLSKEVEDTAFGLEEGAVSEPIELSGGYQLIKVMERTEKAVKPLEDVRGEIVEELNVHKGEELFAKWIQELRDRTYVEIRP